MNEGHFGLDHAEMRQKYYNYYHERCVKVRAKDNRRVNGKPPTWLVDNPLHMEPPYSSRSTAGLINSNSTMVTYFLCHWSKEDLPTDIKTGTTIIVVKIQLLAAGIETATFVLLQHLRWPLPVLLIKDLERSRLTTIFIKVTTHLKLNLQDMFRSCNDHLQLKVELIWSYIWIYNMLNKDK